MKDRDQCKRHHHATVFQSSLTTVSKFFRQTNNKKKKSDDRFPPKEKYPEIRFGRISSQSFSCQPAATHLMQHAENVVCASTISSQFKITITSPPPQPTSMHALVFCTKLAYTHTHTSPNEPVTLFSSLLSLTALCFLCKSSPLS